MTIIARAKPDDIRSQEQLPKAIARFGSLTLLKESSACKGNFAVRFHSSGWLDRGARYLAHEQLSDREITDGKCISIFTRRHHPNR